MVDDVGCDVDGAAPPGISVQTSSQPANGNPDNAALALENTRSTLVGAGVVAVISIVFGLMG